MPPPKRCRRPCPPCSTAARRPTSSLFGRMLADLPEKNMDAACQVAHAISTNKIHSMEMDYYTAVDDINNDNPGADMIGTVEFNSACFYRYATLDVAELVGGYRDEKKTRAFGLQGDAELARTTATAFLTAFIHAIPTGKQNSFAAHNPPSLVFAVVRDGPPVSLANAFVKPVTAAGRREPGREVDRGAGRLLRPARRHVRRRRAEGVGRLPDGRRQALKHLKDEAGSVEKLIATVARPRSTERGRHERAADAAGRADAELGHAAAGSATATPGWSRPGPE